MKQNSRLVSVFHGRELPEAGATLVGYAALLAQYDLNVVLPDRCAVTSLHHKRYETTEWLVFTPRHNPDDTLAGHLSFALKYEGIDLAILNALFACIDPQEITTWVQSEPVGKYSRRIWFLYEWLTEKRLELDDAVTGNSVDLLDATLQYPGVSVMSRRHRVRNNLPGNRDFCPLVRRTKKLQDYEDLRLSQVARSAVNAVQKDILTRASAFLLLKDSRASFQIEDEQPEQERAASWARALGQAGTTALSKEHVLAMQKIVLEGNRFVTLGLRQEGGFIGAHDRITGLPQPEHISARWQDVERLLDGIIALDAQLGCEAMDPVVKAAMVSFGFVFIHPFVDGNGRLHRYLIQHVLAACGFASRGVQFPISAVILESIDVYKQVLESYSCPRLACISWRATERGNVEVLNDTIDLYRYFDATKQAEFLYDCMYELVTQRFPQEVLYLERYDRMKQAVRERFAMPDQLINLLIRFLEQNNGLLSKRTKSNEFKKLSLQECKELEALYSSIFDKR